MVNGNMCGKEKIVMSDSTREVKNILNDWPVE